MNKFEHFTGINTRPGYTQGEKSARLATNDLEQDCTAGQGWRLCFTLRINII